MALMYELRDVLGVGEGQGRVNLSWGANPSICEYIRVYIYIHMCIRTHMHTFIHGASQSVVGRKSKYM